MKCDNLITKVIGKNGNVVIIGKKGKVKLKFYKPMLMIEHLVCEWDELPDAYKGFESQIPPKDAKPCGGNIIVTVEAVNEPDWGGTHALLEITYKCDKCGCKWYPELPTEYNISKFLTKAIEEMPQKKLVKLRKGLKEEADKRTKQLDEFRIQGIEDRKNRQKPRKKK